MKVPAPTLDTWPEQAIRGDRIVGSRYTSQDFMEQEWEGMWTRVWLLLAARLRCLKPVIGKWSRGAREILMVRQQTAPLSVL